MKRIFASAALAGFAASMSLEPSEGYTSGESKSIEEVLEICQGKRDANEDSVFCTALNDISDIQAQIDALNVHIEETKEDPRYFLRNMAGLAARESVSSDEAEVEDLEGAVVGMKRFVDLKKLVSWMQPYDKRISRYCMYGCWCLPEGAHGFVAGVGKPVDLVDKACMQLFQCYECAREAFNGYVNGNEHICDPNTRSYARFLYYDSGDPDNYDLRGIRCENDFIIDNSLANRRQNCARAVCECDKWFSYALYKYESFWSKSRHRIWSRSTASGQFVVADECHFCEAGSSCGQTHTDHDILCCGDFTKGDRFPVRTHDGAMDCCNDGANGGFEWFGVHYNTYTHCCVDSTVTQYCAQASGSGSVALDCKNIVMDVVFLIDESGSVGPSNFAKNLAFAADFINELDLADDKTKVGFAKFDGSYTRVFDFSSDHSSVILDLQSANFNAGGTNIGGAIQGVADDFTNGDFAWRPNTAAWVVVMTDGQDGTSPAGAVSNLIDSKGAGQPTVDILSVGIGSGVDSAQISAIASDPSYAFTISGYNQLSTIKESMGTAMCV